MGVSGTAVPVRNRRRGNSATPRGASPPAANVNATEKDITNIQGKIEADLAKRNMKVSAEAWKAFQVYQQYDDWSSETEKTDYTYSRLSNHRHKEVIPGFPVRPNLSRSPIKPSTPSSAYDYTTERREFEALQKNLRSRTTRSRNNHKQQNDNSIDTVDVSTHEEIAWYRRISQFFSVVWLYVVTRARLVTGSSGTFVQSTSSSFASVFVAIWTWLAVSLQNKSNSVVQMWRQWFRSERSSAIQGNEEGWIRLSSITLRIREVFSQISTKVTTKTYHVYRLASEGGTRTHLLLGLLPLLLVLGWLAYNSENREQFLSYVENIPVHILDSATSFSSQTWESLLSAIKLSYESVVNFVYWGSSSVFSSLSSAFLLVGNGSNYLVTGTSEGVYYGWFTLCEKCHFAWQYACSFVCDSFSSVFSAVSDFFVGFFSTLVGFFSKSYSLGSSAISDGVQYTVGGISGSLFGSVTYLVHSALEGVVFVASSISDGFFLFWNGASSGILSVGSSAVDGLLFAWNFLADGLIFGLNSISNGFLFLFDSIIGAVFVFLDILYSLYGILSNGFIGGITAIQALLVFPNATESEMYSSSSKDDLIVEQTVPSKIMELEPPPTYGLDASYIATLQDRVTALEEKLKLEKARKLSKEQELELAINDLTLVLGQNRLQADVALRRCCRWPCPTWTPPPSNSGFEGRIAQIESLLIGLKKETADAIGQIHTKVVDRVPSQFSDSSLNAELVQKIVDIAIKIYDADKTGRADYALESAGGRVVSIRCTKAYTNRSPSWGWMPTLWSTSGGPEEAIRPGTSPGECWAFQGAIGQLALELSYPVYITGFTLEHIAKELNPSRTIDSAPQHFSVWGLKHADDLTEQYLFGEYTYLDNGATVQYFPIKNPCLKPYKFIELKIVSNHGHPDYTCLYRIRVHGNVT